MLFRFARVFLTILLGLTTTKALAFDLGEYRAHVTANIGSYHLNATREFNESNPGLGVGVAFNLGDGVEIDIETGFYDNSVNRTTTYVMGSLDTEVARAGSTSLRLGGFTGLARYPGEENKFENTGIPTFGEWVMGGGAQASLRFDDRFDIRARAMPAGKVADALFTLQIVAYF